MRAQDGVPLSRGSTGCCSSREIQGLGKNVRDSGSMDYYTAKKSINQLWVTLKRAADLIMEIFCGSTVYMTSLFCKILKHADEWSPLPPDTLMKNLWRCSEGNAGRRGIECDMKRLHEWIPPRRGNDVPRVLGPGKKWEKIGLQEKNMWTLLGEGVSQSPGERLVLVHREMGLSLPLRDGTVDSVAWRPWLNVWPWKLPVYAYGSKFWRWVLVPLNFIYDPTGLTLKVFFCNHGLHAACADIITHIRRIKVSKTRIHPII